MGSEHNCLKNIVYPAIRGPIIILLLLRPRMTIIILKELLSKQY